MKTVRLTIRRDYITWSKDFWEGGEVYDGIHRDHSLPAQYDSIVGVYYDEKGRFYATWNRDSPGPRYVRGPGPLQLVRPYFREKYL